MTTPGGGLLTLKTSEVGSAVILSADTPSLKAGQQSGVTNPNRLINPLAYPIMIDEILFNFGTNPGQSSPADLRIQLMLNNEEIIRAYTPIAVLGKGRNFSTQYTGSGTADQGTFLASQQNVQLYSCRFSSELILQPGEGLNPIFFNAGLFTLATATVIRMSVRGRVLPQETPRTSLPWISYFAGALQTANANYTETSTEANLCNPHSTPLYVERLVGVLCSQDSAENFNANGIYYDAVAADAGLQYCLIRLADHAGTPFVRDNTPFGHVFQQQDYCWEMKTTMPPSGFWYAYLTENYASINVSTAKIQALIGLIGKRPVAS